MSGLLSKSARYLLKTAGVLVIVYTVYITFNLVNKNTGFVRTYFREEFYINDMGMAFVLFKSIMKAPNFTLTADHERVLKMIVNNYSREPSKDPYMLNKPNSNISTWQQIGVIKLLKNKKNGVFVECGAFDGETLSNTLGLETKHGWSGVLIESNPTSYQKLLKKNRKAWTVEACLSPHNYMSEVMMKKGGSMSKLEDTKVTEQIKLNLVKVQCFPLISILLALNITTIDYFSLDIEGEEVKVLKTIPWDKVNITTFSLEFNHIPEGKEGLTKLMSEQGYKVYLDESQLSYKVKRGQKMNIIFYHEKLLGYVP